MIVCVSRIEVILMLENGACCCQGGQAGEHRGVQQSTKQITQLQLLKICRIKLCVVKCVSRMSYGES